MATPDTGPPYRSPRNLPHFLSSSTYQVAWAGLRICMSRAHKRRTRLNGNGYGLHKPAPRLPRTSRLPSASPLTTRQGVDR